MAFLKNLFLDTNRTALKKRTFNLLYFFIFTALIFWSFSFILRTSAIGLDGNRYWTLFDDAMISMRYAFNLVKGHGLVWNPGEYVEGFTNPLWTGLMAIVILIFGKLNAPLVIQIIGLAFIIGSILFVIPTAKKLFSQNQTYTLLAIISILTYYPLFYWSLGGMEVSALTFCTSLALYISICKVHFKFALSTIFFILSAAFLIRPDGFLALIPTIIIYLINKKTHINNKIPSKELLCGAVYFVCIVLLVHVFRFIYYDGTLVPNTYSLKVTGYGLLWRIDNGLRFLSPYLLSTIVLWCLAILPLFKHPIKLLTLENTLLMMPLIAVSYQTYVGGDPWDYWRQMVPSMIPLTLLSIMNLQKLTHQHGTIKYFIITIFFIVTTLLQNKQFNKELFKGKPNEFDSIEKLVQMSNLLNKILDNGSILVFWAGNLPYYYEGHAIDALGKSDKHIASLQPNPTVKWNRMIGVPGHAKYSLQYSLVDKKPDFIQYYKWFSDDYSLFVDREYVAVKYNEKIACVKKSSKKVRWNLVSILGKCTEYEQLIF